MSKVDSSRIASRFKADDETALKELIELYQVSLHRFIYRYVNDASETEDILFRTFVKAWNNRRQVRPAASIQTWLFTIAKNLCLDYTRTQRRHPSDYSALQEPFDEQEHSSLVANSQEKDAPTKVAQSEDYQLLRSAILKLPPDLKSALILCSLEGHSQEEAARLLGCSPKAVETRVYRAKKKLLEHFSNSHR